MKYMYGIHKSAPVSDSQIIRDAQKLRIPANRLYELDSLQLLRIYRLQQLGYSNAAKQLHQPLQVMYFDEEGRLLSQHLNCHAVSFPDLRWNRHHSFLQFPPPGNSSADRILTLPLLQQMLRPLFCADTGHSKGSRYHVVLFWNKFMGRQSKRLVRLVQRNAAFHADNKIAIYYVNNDNYHSLKGLLQLQPEMLSSIDSVILQSSSIQGTDPAVILR
jgi:hypothetical protein